MSNKDKTWQEEYESIQREIFSDKIRDAVKDEPRQWAKKLEELGFIWVDEDNDEAEEEKNALPMNANQCHLMAYFSKESELTHQLIDLFIVETEGDEPNYPLFRPYFKAGNNRLLQLLLSGLSRFPTNTALLSAIRYYHEYRPILSLVIDTHIKACKQEQNIDKYNDLTIDFVNATYADGYDAVAELRTIFDDDSNKKTILDSITLMIHDYDEEYRSLEF